MDYVVKLTASSEVLVTDAESEEDAMNIAYDSASMFNFDLDAVSKVTEVSDPVDLERAKRHCNQII